MITRRPFRTGTLLATFCAAAMAMPRREAQFQGRQRTPNDSLKSTEVLPDQKVTFRIYAPKANEVSIGGDFGGAASSPRTTRASGRSRSDH